MIIPIENKTKRNDKLQEILGTCLESAEERRVKYNRRRRYFLFGTNGESRVRYNRLQSHLDMVASFLYAADHARYSISAPRNSEDSLVQQVLALEDDWNDTFNDTSLAHLVYDAILWALINDATPIKLGWSSTSDDLFGKMIDPGMFGVYDETEPDLDSQEAFVHTYTLHWDNAILRCLRAFGEKRGKEMVKKLNAGYGPKDNSYPPVLANMLITATGGANLSGPMMGQVVPNYEAITTYEPKTNFPTVRFHELYVWDDMSEDYAIFTMTEGIDEPVSDSRETIAALAKAANRDVDDYASKSNIFLPDEHPFVIIRPFGLPDYFWGESHCERLIRLQDWTNERLEQIAEILAQQVDPAKVFSGFMGLADEKAAALGGPGSWVVDQLPNAKVERLLPEMPEDLFSEVKEIGAIFMEASGLTETVTGKGEQGVRGRGHAKQLATTGSSRIRKIAVGLEPALVKLGDVGLKLKQKNSPIRLKTDDGQTLVPALVGTERWKIRIAGHSHSPLFADEAKDESAILLKARAIDEEMFIRLRNPPHSDNMIYSLRKRKAAQAKMVKEHPELLNQGGRGKPNGKAPHNSPG
jgi:hypothetical protein